jgi:cell division protein FtsQ
MDNEKLNNTGNGKQRIRRLGVFLTIPLIAIIFVVCFLAAEWRDTLKVSRIMVEGVRIMPVKYIKTLADVKDNSSMNIVNLFNIQENLKTQPFVRSVCVTRQYPDAINLQIDERTPIATLSTKQLRYIDEEGFLLPFIETAVRLDLPIITGVQGIEQTAVGKVDTNKEIHEAIAILQRAVAIDSTLYRFISEINMKNGDDIILYSAESAVPIILGRENYAKKLLMLQTFWNNFIRSQNTQRLQQIDLRFNDQVVVRWLTDDQQAKINP